MFWPQSMFCGEDRNLSAVSDFILCYCLQYSLFVSLWKFFTQTVSEKVIRGHIVYNLKSRLSRSAAQAQKVQLDHIKHPHLHTLFISYISEPSQIYKKNPNWAEYWS